MFSNNIFFNHFHLFYDVILKYRIFLIKRVNENSIFEI